MKHSFIIAVALLLGACTVGSSSEQSQPTSQQSMPRLVQKIESAETPTLAPYRSDLPNLGPAPELHNTVWLNSEEPLRLAELRGQVVLLEMWTFGCYNCQNVIPSLKRWHEEYGPEGLVIIGNHYPEFDYEADLDNLKAAVQRYGIEYAVAQDNNRETWGAYHNRYWPTLYLIDKWGNIRYKHIGEGAYTKTDAAIKDLLAETYPGT